jgi:hypothetical protein
MLLWFNTGFPAYADEEKGGYNRPTLENQLKFAVPEAIAENLWQTILQKYSTPTLRKINPNFSSEVSSDLYVDVYFDDNRSTLLRKKTGLRHRRLLQGREVERQFLQLKTKLPNRQLRREFKLNVNDRPDKKTAHTSHPFLSLVRRRDYHLVDSLLATLGVQATALKPALELSQQRRRLYLYDQGNEMAYISLDQVYTQNQEQNFYELELALPENIYTTANNQQRGQMQHLLEILQLDLTNTYPMLQQDQTPKYNKMYNLRNGRQMRPAYFNFAWGAIGILLVILGYYLFRNGRKPEPTPPRLI